MSEENSFVVKTPEFRVSYPHVFEPRLNEQSGKMEYTIMAVFPKGADLSQMERAALNALRQGWGDKPPAGVRKPFRKHEEKADDNGNLPDGMEPGGIFINAKSKMRPGVVGTAVDPLTGKLEVLDETTFYPGCYAVMTVNAYPYGHPAGKIDTKGNKGVSFGIRNIQKTRDGAPLGSRTRPEDDFEPVETADGSTPKTSDDLWGE